MKTYTEQELRVLFMQLSEGQLSTNEIHALDQYLTEHPEAISQLARFMALQGILYKRNSRLQVHEVNQDPEALMGLAEACRETKENLQKTPKDSQHIKNIEQYAQHQLNVFLREQAEKKAAEQRLKSPPRHHDHELWQETKQRILRLARFTRRVIIASAAILLIVLVVWGIYQNHVNQRVIAKLDSTQNAEWIDAPQTAELKRGWLELCSGCAELTMHNGTQVLIQAPCSVQLLSPESLYLFTGKLTAKVPQRAQGFTVHTSYSQFIDYGTEFGVAVDASQQAQMHVFDGKVGVQNANLRKPQLFSKGEGVTTTKDGRLLPPPYNHSQVFLRDIPDPCYPAIPGQRIDLADIVGGGNGYGTGYLNRGYNPSTGHVVQAPVNSIQVDYLYHFSEITASKFIDGIFVPNGTQSPVIITSTGITWDQCPPTNGNYFEGIINGALMSRLESGKTTQGIMNKTIYGSLAHPAINMHPNAGITFDLQALRKEFPFGARYQFSTRCGLSDNIELGSVPAQEIESWILIDGVVQHQKTYMNDRPENSFIEIPLAPEARFLTLATTGSEENTLCWSFFGEPMLELTP